MIQLTPTLYAVLVPIRFNKFVIKQYNRAGTYIMETDSKELNHWKVNIAKGNYELLGTYSPDGIDFDCDFMGIGTKDAFRSLMYYQNCDLSKKYVIVKIKK